MLGPHEGAIVDDLQPIQFRGMTTAPNTLVTLKASTSSAGAYSTWDGSSTRSGSSVAAYWSGSNYYEWSLSSRVPARFWTDGADDLGCPARTTFLRASSGAVGLFTSNTPELDTEACLLAHDGDPNAALEECMISERAGVARITDSATYTGDVVLRTAADIANYRCYDSIIGSLTIDVPMDAASVVSLPRLSQVTGDVTLVYNGRSVPPVGAMVVHRFICGQDTAVPAEFTRFELPRLKQAARDLTLLQRGNFSRLLGWPGYTLGLKFDLGLPDLSGVGRHLAITSEQFEGSPCGLSSLGHVDGNLSVRLPVGTAWHSSPERLAPSLTWVGGTLDLRAVAIHDVTLPLAALASVGDLLITGSPAVAGLSYTLPALTEVRRTAGFVNASNNSTPRAITRIGNLSVTGSNLSFEMLGGATLTLGGLVYTDNTTPSILSSRGTTKVRLEREAPVQFARNTALPSSEICAFLRLQRLLGWGARPDLGDITCP